MFRANAFLGLIYSGIESEMSAVASKSESGLIKPLACSTAAKERILRSKYPCPMEDNVAASGEETADRIRTEKYRGRHMSSR